MTKITMKYLQKHTDLRKLYPLSLSQTMELGKFKQLSDEDKLNVVVPIVIDGAKWVASDRPLNSMTDIDSAYIVSSDGVFVAKQIRRKKFSVQRESEHEAGTLVGVDYVGNLYPAGKIRNIKNFEEMVVVSKEETKALEALQNLDSVDLGDLGNLTIPAGNEMSSFDQSGALETEAPSVGLKAGVTSRLESVETADASKLQKFNYYNGSIIGYVVSTDARIEFNTRSEVRMEGGRTFVKSNAPDDIKKQHAQNDEVARKYLQQELSIITRQVKPGKTLGMFIEIPEGGLVDIVKFREAGRIEPDVNNTTLIKQLFSKEMGYTMIDLYFGSLIKENEKTHGGAAAGDVKLRSTVRFVTKEGEASSQQRVTNVLKPTNRRSLLTATNYLPLKTYNTIDISKNLTPDEIETLNMSAFYTFVTSRREDDETKYSLLVAADKNKIKPDEHGNVTSKYFTQNLNDREAVEVRPFYDPQNGEPLSKIEIPVKIRKAKDGVLGQPKFDMINALDEKLDQNPERKALSSLESGRFTTILEAAGSAASIDNLRELTRRKTASNKPSNVLSNEQVMKLRLGMAENLLDESEITFAEATPEFKVLEDKINDLIMSK